jgi:hypothetical protein
VRNFQCRIEYEAANAAKITTTDPERIKAFTKGAIFAAEYLMRVMAVSPPERIKAFTKGAIFAAEYLMRVMAVSPQEDDAGVGQFLDKLRLKDVREALRYLLEHIKVEE